MQHSGLQHSTCAGPAISPTAELFQPLGQHVWQGISGRRYAHIVYSLVGCPAPQSAIYLFVCRDRDGNRTVLGAGRTLNTAPSLNLAVIRREGARLGANEVHLHLLAETEDDWAATAFDIAAAQGLLERADEAAA